MATAQHLERRRVIFSGQVQGVGFRYQTRAIAARFAVAGTVENLADGTVEVVVEGAAAEIDRFLGAVTAELGRHIRGQQTSRSEPQGNFAGFQILR